MARRKTRRLGRDPQAVFAAAVHRIKAEAVAVFNDPKVKGAVSFLQVRPGVIQVDAHIWELPPGKHGFHVHECGNMLEGCASLGAHWNPTEKNHGGLYGTERHMGDFGNVVKDQRLRFKISTASVTDLLGRSVVIHEGEDDLGHGDKPDSKTTGGSGARIGCAIIGRA